MAALAALCRPTASLLLACCDLVLGRAASPSTAPPSCAICGGALKSWRRRPPTTAASPPTSASSPCSVRGSCLGGPPQPGRAARRRVRLRVCQSAAAIPRPPAFAATALAPLRTHPLPAPLPAPPPALYPSAGFKVFLEQSVDVVILEVGLGGRLDATNCVRSPVVCGVSSLGYDHMELLGHTLPEIAREKAGIFKPGVPAFTVPQPDDALAALRDKAVAVGTPLAVVRPWGAYNGAEAVALGLAGEHQKLNAALAVALAATWEGVAGGAAGGGPAAAERAAEVAAGRLPAVYAAGLSAASWPGRGQIVHDAVNAPAGGSCDSAGGGAAEQRPAQPAQPAQQQEQQGPRRLSFYLDGAHTAESMATCAHWFADTIGSPQAAPAGGAAGAANGALEQAQAAEQPGPITQNVLLFNCMQAGCAAPVLPHSAPAAQAALHLAPVVLGNASWPACCWSTRPPSCCAQPAPTQPLAPTHQHTRT